MFQHRRSEFEPSVNAIQKHLMAVEKELENLGRMAGGRGLAAASGASEQIGDALTSIMTDLVERFRDGGRRAVQLGSSYGNSAMQRVSGEAEGRSLITAGVALGIGVLIAAAYLGSQRRQ